MVDSDPFLEVYSLDLVDILWDLDMMDLNLEDKKLHHNVIDRDHRIFSTTTELSSLHQLQVQRLYIEQEHMWRGQETDSEEIRCQDSDKFPDPPAAVNLCEEVIVRE